MCTLCPARQSELPRASYDALHVWQHLQRVPVVPSAAQLRDQCKRQGQPTGLFWPAPWGCLHWNTRRGWPIMRVLSVLQHPASQAPLPAIVTRRWLLQAQSTGPPCDWETARWTWPPARGWARWTPRRGWGLGAQWWARTSQMRCLPWCAMPHWAPARL